MHCQSAVKFAPKSVSVVAALAVTVAGCTLLMRGGRRTWSVTPFDAAPPSTTTDTEMLDEKDDVAGAVSDVQTNVVLFRIVAATMRPPDA
jgi:hypothetical protein